MWPKLIEIGPITLHCYGLMIALGFLAALWIAQREARRQNISPQVIADATFWALFLGLAGTRVLHLLMYPSFYSWRDPIGWIAIWRGGLVFQGGPPVVIVFLYFYLRKKGVPPWKVADIGFPCLAIGHALGRLGCFLKGCCYGVRTDLPWGIRFPRVPWDLAQPPEGSPAYLDHCDRFSELSYTTDHWSYPVHPTQLYEFTALIVLFFLLQSLKKRWHPFDGFTMPVYFVYYGTYRFLAEFIRGDHNPTHFGGTLSDQQVFCIVFVLAGILLFPILRYRAARESR